LRSSRPTQGSKTDDDDDDDEYSFKVIFLRVTLYVKNSVCHAVIKEGAENVTPK